MLSRLEFFHVISVTQALSGRSWPPQTSIDVVPLPTFPSPAPTLSLLPLSCFIYLLDRRLFGQVAGASVCTCRCVSQTCARRICVYMHVRITYICARTLAHTHTHIHIRTRSPTRAHTDTDGARTCQRRLRMCCESHVHIRTLTHQKKKFSHTPKTKKQTQAAHVL